VPLLGRDRRIEVKIRANGFRRLYDWLSGADMLVVRADRHEPLLVVPLRFAMEVAAAAENWDTSGPSRADKVHGPFLSHAIIGEA
jgi:hypothetical protein